MTHGAWSMIHAGAIAGAPTLENGLIGRPSPLRFAIDRFAIDRFAIDGFAIDRSIRQWRARGRVSPTGVRGGAALGGPGW